MQIVSEWEAWIHWQVYSLYTGYYPEEPLLKALRIAEISREERAQLPGKTSVVLTYKDGVIVRDGEWAPRIVGFKGAS